MFKVLLCVTTQHDWWLVAVAAAVCLPASLSTFLLYSKVPASPPWRRWTWLGMTGLVAGSGIWTTHFVAMLAFKTGLPTGYAAVATLGSLVVAIAGCTLGFALASSLGAAARLPAVIGGLMVGICVTAMHYIGMLGYRTAGFEQWDHAYVVASAVLGAVFAAAALYVARPGAGPRIQAAGAALLALGIVAMHFTGMAAVTIIPDPTVAVPANVMSPTVMAIAAVAATAVILLTAVVGVAFDSLSRNGNLRRLREALDVMPGGLAFYDAADRLVAWNAQYADQRRRAGVNLIVGMGFADILKAELAHGTHPNAKGREARWLTERIAARWGDAPAIIQQLSDGRWLRINEGRTADGGTICVSLDITDLKRAEAEIARARDAAVEMARRAEFAEEIAQLGHWRLDVRANAINWSSQTHRIYGLPRGEPPGVETLNGMVHPDDVADRNARREQLLATGEPIDNVVLRIRRPDGEVRHLSTNSRVERGPDGEIVAIVGTVVDVTQQKAAELALIESEERFRRLADNAPDMISESRLDGTLTYVSPASLAITGYAPEELVGRSAFSVMAPDDADRVLAMCRAVFESKGVIPPWPVEFRGRHKDGREMWFECKPTLTTDPVTGRFVGLNDVIRDITERKQLEAQLRLAQADAEAAAAVKAEFLANMSHELRTPLTSILGFTGLAAEQPELSELTRNYVERVADASRALLCTVNDILDFSKLEAGQVAIEPKPVDLARLNRATLDLFTPQAGAKDLSLTLDEDTAASALVVALDPDRIRQILLNLVSNAVKFTEAGGVTLRSRYDVGREMLSVEVIDTGGGIAPDKLDRLFKRFSQIDGSQSRIQRGTGLGLAICKGLAEAMGGEIGVDSRLGEGSRFWFRVPAPRASLADAETAAPPVERPPFSGVRALVVDDHPANRELVRLFLAGVGAEVTDARDGEEGAQIAAERPFDVILMDMRMPKLDGPGALRRIREAGGCNAATPILAFTADGDPEILDSLMALGFQDVVSKPLEPAALIGAVARATTVAADEDPAAALVA